MKKPYTNNTAGIQHIGCVTVMPGQTREVEESHIQAHFGGAEEAPPAEKTEDPHALFLSANVKVIKENINDLSAEDLDAIEKLESAKDQPRQGVMKAIAERRLQLAAADDATDMEAFIKSLDGMSDEELAEQHELYTDEPDSSAYLEAVNAEIEKRNAAGAND